MENGGFKTADYELGLYIDGVKVANAVVFLDRMLCVIAKLVVCIPRKNALLKDGNKSDRIDARKLAELFNFS